MKYFLKDLVDQRKFVTVSVFFVGVDVFNFEK